MPRITVNGRVIECKDRQMILQACNDAGLEIPQYCYHPGLSIVASCRICLVEVEGIPKLVPSCQTPVREGMVVHSDSPKAVANQKQVMEYLLINHPLDCPVCDQAGECFLQDYSYKFGRAQSRFEEDKIKKPKKDVGEHVLLYNDRCIMCTRCVRFTREVSGASELYVDGRGSKEEIDIFPGRPLDNKLSGNVVDLCPVGALLDKEFLFQQRVWLLRSTPSISPVDAGGENIYIDHNEGRIRRIRPRANPQVNQWWISDDTRYGFKAVHDPARLREAQRSQYGTQVALPLDSALDHAQTALKEVVAQNGPGSLFAMLSPMMACEEAWLLAKYIRALDPKALLIQGPVPTSAADEVFKSATTGKQTFVIKAQKVPNAAGIKRVMDLLGGPTATFAEASDDERADVKALKGGWIVGGYLSAWQPEKAPAWFSGQTVVQDILGGGAADGALIVIPGAAWAEKDGCWENYQGTLQHFSAAIAPPQGVRRDGDIYYMLLGRSGMYRAADVRKEMGAPFDAVTEPSEHAVELPLEFVEI